MGKKEEREKGKSIKAEKKAKIDRMHKMNLFKLQLMPAFVPGSEE